ncbi:MAG TPA: hypothetical protein VM286_10805 [Candidatus Thermoplasmatota archaeon]|nr:hypothetical protein [Candidatus Thermoplasmatota archaeon]
MPKPAFRRPSPAHAALASLAALALLACLALPATAENVNNPVGYVETMVALEIYVHVVIANPVPATQPSSSPLNAMLNAIEIQGPDTLCVAALANECFQARFCEGLKPLESTRVYPDPVIYVEAGYNGPGAYAGYSTRC